METPELARAVAWLSWINTAKVIGAFLVAVGVGAEFVGEFVARPFEKTIETATQGELARLNNETARLSSEAAHAKSEIARANSDAAKANEAAAKAGERAAQLQLELEQLKRPRSLTAAQTSALKAGLIEWADKFDMKLTVASTHESEPRMYASQFMTAFTDVGIRLVNRQDGPHEDLEERSRGPTDLAVVIDSEEYRPLAEHLVRALKAAGLASTLDRIDRLQFGRIYLAVFAKR